jgi:hypothetical protein
MYVKRREFRFAGAAAPVLCRMELSTPELATILSVQIHREYCLLQSCTTQPTPIQFGDSEPEFVTYTNILPNLTYIYFLDQI